MIAAGVLVSAAAKEAGVGERTVYHWLEDPEYRTLVAAFRDRILSRVVGLLTEASTKAAAVLESLPGTDSEWSRLRAAHSIIDLMIRAREHGELAARVAALENVYRREADPHEPSRRSAGEVGAGVGPRVGPPCDRRRGPGVGRHRAPGTIRSSGDGRNVILFVPPECEADPVAGLTGTQRAYLR